MLKTAINLANKNQEKVIVLVNKTIKGVNTIIIRNRNFDFNLKLWGENLFKTTNFKGGVNPSMLQLVSFNPEDSKKLLAFLISCALFLVFAKFLLIFEFRLLIWLHKNSIFLLTTQLAKFPNVLGLFLSNNPHNNS